ncbi:Peptidase C2, calpain family like protein [Aduncisulcus paluster]|uniref:Peptidase C2, calpain family like protein n=1 Tax=Aduncisulcus paluster TaxID=2918883 RepID=A0ABQ5KB41_9EUKA|nr:Peptidase C2, calpain family like protein [Aduncisulcus paluster]|eukprot:gnl/Carplike_NY0171/660_a909_2263.p1 GENE.gnl/Carplike_NY0171/660_a909_2263~~gnl/Carplike_NY0171/660_a909_2263.p1  ORF type:complete len:657 (+),score=174.60 gnl/Carplike_NY0171/660_a909_2263:48-2018(+)
MSNPYQTTQPDIDEDDIYVYGTEPAQYPHPIDNPTPDPPIIQPPVQGGVQYPTDPGVMQQPMMQPVMQPMMQPMMQPHVSNPYGVPTSGDIQLQTGVPGLLDDTEVPIVPPTEDIIQEGAELEETPKKKSHKKCCCITWIIIALLVIICIVLCCIFCVRVPRVAEPGSVWSIFGMVPVADASIYFYSFPDTITDSMRVFTDSIFTHNLDDSDYSYIGEDGGINEHKSPSEGQYQDFLFNFPASDAYTTHRPLPGSSVVVESFDSSDIAQGAIGDCWFLSALASVANDGTLEYVRPRWDSSTGKVVGSLFFGDKLVEILTDDILAYYTNYNDIQYYARSTDDGEMWVSFQEKILAKLAGGYANLDGNILESGFMMLRPGFPIGNYDLDLISDSEHTKLLKNGIKHNGAITAAIASIDGQDYIDGLPTGHAYSVLSITDVPDDIVTGGVTLYEVRNPWAMTEYNGPYSDSDDIWLTNPQLAQYMDFEDKNDGLFYIQESDFYSIYDDYVIMSSPNEYKLSVIAEIPISLPDIVGIDVYFPPSNEEVFWFMSLDLPPKVTPDIYYDGDDTHIISFGDGAFGYKIPPHNQEEYHFFYLAPTQGDYAVGRVAMFSTDEEWSFEMFLCDGYTYNCGYSSLEEVKKPSYINKQTKYIIKNLDK